MRTSKLICFFLALYLQGEVFAQAFIHKTNAENYFTGIDVGDFAAPSFVDIDNDGDDDAFIGGRNGRIQFYRNVGTKLNPQYLVEVAANPLSSVFVGGFAAPTFADIDGDGDKDAFIGSEENGISFYVNNGTASAGNFTLSNTLFGDVYFEIYAKSSFVDIDKDGDLDLFVGDGLGATNYYKNTGTSVAPVFQVSPTNPNPLASVTSAQFAAPAFLDYDKDGDYDFVLGGSGSSLRFYDNNGSASAANFILKSGVESPFNGIIAIPSPNAAFADIDDDGDMDLFIGGADGQMRSFANNTINLPLKLIAFTAVTTSDIAIAWKTADELNTLSFELQKSGDGRNFTAFKTIPAIGSGGNGYSARDKASISTSYYRLKMIDIDGSYTYSHVIQSNSGVAFKTHIYPVPAEQTLTIEFPTQLIAPIGVTILDISGRTHINTTLNSRKSRLPISLLDKGTYVLKLQNGDSYLFVKN